MQKDDETHTDKIKKKIENFFLFTIYLRGTPSVLYSCVAFSEEI